MAEQAKMRQRTASNVYTWFPFRSPTIRHRQNVFFVEHTRRGFWWQKEKLMWSRQNLPPRGVLGRSPAIIGSDDSESFASSRVQEAYTLVSLCRTASRFNGEIKLDLERHPAFSGKTTLLKNIITQDLFRLAVEWPAPATIHESPTFV